MPLSTLATTLVRDPQLLVVNVFDPAVRLLHPLCALAALLDCLSNARYKRLCLCVAYRAFMRPSLTFADEGQRGESYQGFASAA